MNLKDCVGVIHSANPCAFQHTLCGLAYDAPLEDESDICTDDIMTETGKPIDCPECIRLIRYCKNLKYKKIKNK